MNTIKELEDLQKEMQTWRRDIHAHPEIAFEEHRTAQVVAEKLESFGIEVETGIAGTGVVGTLKKGTGNRSIGLRADLDALLINEANEFEHKSKNPGKMHACGHDGHTVMLLGAAKYLAEKGNFEHFVSFLTGRSSLNKWIYHFGRAKLRRSKIGSVSAEQPCFRPT